MLARKGFSVNRIADARLLISADSRYRCYINGQWVNDGPARAFPSEYSYDVIDVGRYLHIGPNVIAVEVLHFGEGNFQHLVTRGGLLVQLEIASAGGKTRFVNSDKSWKVVIDPAYNSQSPRISCQMWHEEQFNAAKAISGWRCKGFNDRCWLNAVEICEARQGPWEKLTARDIPLLSREEITPSSLISARYVKPPCLAETLNLKRLFWPDRTDSNARYFRGVIITDIKSPCEQKVSINLQPTIASVQLEQMFLNGRQVKRSEIHLKKGSNPFLVRYDSENHFDELTLTIHAENTLKLKNPFGLGKWGAIGPCEERDEIWNKIKGAKSLFKIKPFTQEIKKTDSSTETNYDVSSRTCFQKTVKGTPEIISPEGMFSDNDEYTVIKKSQQDVEIVVDLGKEYNTHIGFEIYADQGVIIDGNIFEEYWKGKPRYPWSNRSTFGYVTRKGWQKYLTFRHLGGRYIALTFRNLKSSLKIRRVYGVFVHYQVQNRGEFHCSNSMLNRLWDLGKHTLLCCMEDTFTDCPTFEQTLWILDARNEALICEAAFGESEITRRSIRMAALSLKRSDMVESQVPSAWQDIIPSFSLIWVQMIWEYFWFSSDRIFLDELYPFVSKMLNSILDKYIDAKTNLFCINKWNFLDWSHIDSNHKCVTHNNILLAAALDYASKIAGALGKRSDKRRWLNAAGIVRTAINKEMWSETKNAYIDSIHNDGEKSTTVSHPVNTLAMLYNIAPKNRKKHIAEIVMGKRKKGIVPFGAPGIMFFLLEQYAESGKIKELLKFMHGPWREMLDAGATTLWEMYKSFASEEYPTRSYCHGWSAGPTYFMSRYILGVHALKPGFTQVLIQPELDNLKFARGKVPANKYDICADWRRKNNHFYGSIKLPKEIKASFKLPSNIKASRLTINNRTITGDLSRTIPLPRVSQIRIEAYIAKKKN